MTRGVPARYTRAYIESVDRRRRASVGPLVASHPIQELWAETETSLSAEVTSTVRIAAASRAGKRKVGLLALCGLALITGLVTGVGAVLFHALIALVHNLFYSGTISASYDANLLEPPSPWGWLVLFSPVVGGLIVVWLVQTFAPEAKGHGVPEVMDAVFYKRGHIRGVVAVVKSLASAISIGSGAAVGREGPIIQIGSALGSTFGRRLGLKSWQTITLLAAGAGAGIAATFNTPLGGVLFALEILLPEVSNRTFLPVVIATGSATYVGRLLLGPDPAFTVPEIHAAVTGVLDIADVLSLVAIGLVCGLASWAFIKLLAWTEDWFPTLPGGPYVQNVIGMTALGLMMVGCIEVFGHPYVNGVGYGVIQAILDGRMGTVWLLVLLFGLKLVATCISLGCGASGGIFSPSLYLGATLGGAVGALLATILPSHGISVPASAIVGMAAVVGAGTGGVMTAIVMIFEMTRDYTVMVPVILAVAVAAGVRRSLVSETIYTIKLRHRGHRIPKERHINLYLVQQARDVMERSFTVARCGTPLLDVLGHEPTDILPPIIIEREGRIVGLVPPRSGLWSAALREPTAPVESFARADFVLVRDTDPMSRVFTRLHRRQRGAALVSTGTGVPRIGDIVGVITKRAIADAVIENFEE